MGHDVRLLTNGHFVECPLGVQVDTMTQETDKRTRSGTEETGAAGPWKRKRYSVAYKRRVVEEVLTGKDSVSVVAR